MSNLEKSKQKILLIIIGMVFILGMSIDLYSPSFPSIVKGLKTKEDLVQMTIATYFLGYTLGLFFLGPLSDALGRKKPLVASLFFYVIVSFFCSISTNIYFLLLFRFFQGIGVSAVGVIYRSILGDVFSGGYLAKSMNYATMSNRFGPIISPVIGGYLDVYFGWQSNFYFLMAYGGLILLLVLFFLPETHYERFPLDIKLIWGKFNSIIRLKSFLGGSLCYGISYAMLISFNVVGPFFIQDVLNFSPIGFGHIALFMGLAVFLGTLFNRFLIHFYPITKVVSKTLYAMIILGILQVIFAFIFPVNLYSFLIPVGLFFILSGFIHSNVSSLLIDIIHKGKGTASAIMVIIITSTTAIITFISSFLRSDNIVPFAFAYFVMSILCLLFFHFLYKKCQVANK